MRISTKDLSQPYIFKLTKANKTLMESEKANDQPPPLELVRRLSCWKVLGDREVMGSTPAIQLQICWFLPSHGVGVPDWLT